MTERIIWRGDGSLVAQLAWPPEPGDVNAQSFRSAAQTSDATDYRASAAVACILYPDAQAGRWLRERLTFFDGPGVLDQAAAVIEYFAEENEL